MKMNQRRLLPILALLILTSCAQIESGNDPVVVNAERDTRIAADTFALIAQTEKDNRQLLYSVNPALALKVKHGVDFIRANAKTWLLTARSLTTTYKNNRSPDNKANLSTALATLAQGVFQAQTYLNEINQAKIKQ